MPEHHMRKDAARADFRMTRKDAARAKGVPRGGATRPWPPPIHLLKNYT